MSKSKKLKGWSDRVIESDLPPLEPLSKTVGLPKPPGEDPQVLHKEISRLKQAYHTMRLQYLDERAKVHNLNGKLMKYMERDHAEEAIKLTTLIEEAREEMENEVEKISVESLAKDIETDCFGPIKNEEEE